LLFRDRLAHLDLFIVSAVKTHAFIVLTFHFVAKHASQTFVESSGFGKDFDVHFRKANTAISFYSFYSWQQFTQTYHMACSIGDHSSSTEVG